MRKALVVVLAVGCGDNYGDPRAYGDFLQAFVEALCTHKASCGEFPDLDTCLRASHFNVKVNPTVAATISAGKRERQLQRRRHVLHAAGVHLTQVPAE
jgi:hypothetical protein